MSGLICINDQRENQKNVITGGAVLTNDERMSLENIIKYMYFEEMKHYQETACGDRHDHIFRDVVRLRRALNINPRIFDD